jgi:hypothetical protein
MGSGLDDLAVVQGGVGDAVVGRRVRRRSGRRSQRERKAEGRAKRAHRTVSIAQIS